MQHSLLIYEQPVTSIMQLCLQLEHAFTKINHYATSTQFYDSQTTLENLLQLLTLLDQADCKPQLIQATQRHIQRLSLLHKTPQVDTTKLNEVLNELTQSETFLHQCPGRLSQRLHTNPLVEDIMQLQHHTQVTAAYQLPNYSYWQHQPAGVRTNDIKLWISSIEPIYKTIALLLRLTRHHAIAHVKTANAGLYRDSMNEKAPYQLIRVAIPKDMTVYPNIHIGQRCLLIRFMKYHPAQEATQTNDDITFELIACS